MDFYYEWPIRCITCGEQISCIAATFTTLRDSYLDQGSKGQGPKDQGFTTAQANSTACDDLGIINPCCRSALFNPCVTMFNMENHQAVEGVIDVTTANSISTSRSDGNISAGICQEAAVISQPVNTLTLFSQPRAAMTDVTVPPIARSSTVGLQPIRDKVETVTVDQYVEENTEFDAPTIPGRPTFNYDPTFPHIPTKVGPNIKYTTMTLSGATYLCR